MSPVTSSEFTTPTFLEFFAGAGLVRLALEPQWRCLWANDVCEKKAAVYRANFGACELIVGDVAALRPESLPTALMAWVSFPCQDLSFAGRRRGLSAERSGTFWSVYHLLRALNSQDRCPPLIVIENVLGLLSRQSFVPLCDALSTLGKRLGALVLDARSFVPQSRPRAFIIAFNESLDVAGLTRSAPASTLLFPRSLVAAVRSLPRSTRRRWVWWELPAPPNIPTPIGALIDTSISGAGWLPPSRVNHLLEMTSPINRKRIEDCRIGGGHHMGFLYRRTRNGVQRAEVRFDGIAGCLRTPAGGSSWQTVLFVEHGAVRMRRLAPREAARLMGVPDTYRLPAIDGQAYQAMADGVVVPVAEWLSTALLLPLVQRFRSAPPRASFRWPNA